METKTQKEQWLSPLLQDHPLVGKIWKPPKTVWVDKAQLIKECINAECVLLGEKHDNPDHHRLQHIILGKILESGRTPALVLEMLDSDKQSLVDRVVQENPDTENFAQTTEWEKNWSFWPMYRPLLQQALSNNLRIVAANFPRQQTRKLVRQGLEGIDAEIAQRLFLDQPLDSITQKVMLHELSEVHCGHLPGEMVEKMIFAQRARDAMMAERTLQNTSESGAVLIAGNGHVRKDRGVPYVMNKMNTNLSILSIAFVEVLPNRQDPDDYSSVFFADTLPFDFVWFSPRAHDKDPFEAFRKMKH